MNITKAPWTILSDILISATVNRRYLPLSCGSGGMARFQSGYVGSVSMDVCVDGLLEGCVVCLGINLSTDRVCLGVSACA